MTICFFANFGSTTGPLDVYFLHWKGPTGILHRKKLMLEQLLNLEQVAEYLNVDNQWRFKRKLIENWLAKHSNVRRKEAPQKKRIEEAKKRVTS